MLEQILLPDAHSLYLDFVSLEEDTIVFGTQSHQEAVPCPCCDVPSERIHSSYQRSPADVPICGYPVRLCLNVRRFFCDVLGCAREIFTERLPSVVAPYARKTERLVHQQTQVAYALGGEAGAFILMLLGMPTSADTLLHLIRNAPEPELIVPRVLGVDDFALRKGQHYGTILVDLEAHQPVDLLPERSAESFAAWLVSHPGVEVISRDRGGEYIKGANDGAPDAVQVADRWHLLENLRDGLECFLRDKPVCLRAAALEAATDSGALDNSDGVDVSSAQETAAVEQETATVAEAPDLVVDKSDTMPPVTPESPPKLTKAAKDKLARRARRTQRYETVHTLHEQGFTNAEIARQQKMSPHTVAKYLRADSCPFYPEGVTRTSKLDAYTHYLEQRWEQGCHNAAQLWREIRERGFEGSRGLVTRWAAKRRPVMQMRASTVQDSQQKQRPQAIVPWTPSRAAWLLVKPEEDLDPEEQQALERMRQADGQVAQAHTLGQRFVSMLKDRQSEALAPWLEEATSSGIEAFRAFAKGIYQDLAAVTNALCLPWSNGQTEGQVNRLKLIKRAMYGRANFDLLRKRVLAHPLRC